MTPGRSSMLCHSCAVIFKRTTDVAHLENFEKFREGVELGCYLCAALSERISKDTLWRSSINNINGPLFRYDLDTGNATRHPRLTFFIQIQPEERTDRFGKMFDILSVMHQFTLVPLQPDVPPSREQKFSGLSDCLRMFSS